MMRAWFSSTRIRTVAAFALLAGSYSFAQTGDGLRYKVYYQCNGERVQVDHCRKDDDGMGYGPYQSALAIQPDTKFAAAYHWIGLSYESLKKFDPAAK